MSVSNSPATTGLRRRGSSETLLLTPEQEALWTPESGLSTPKAAPLAYPGNVYHDPLSGLSIPKDRDENLKWRTKLWTMAYKSRADCAGLLTLCRKSPVLFINLFINTLRLREAIDGGQERTTLDRDRPFITWPYQDREILRIHRAFHGNGKIRWVKTRDIGATWLSAAYDLYLVTLFEQHHTLWGSHREAEVYDEVNPKAIFSKIKHAVDRMPDFLLPKGYTMKQIKLVVPSTESTITGEPTTPTFGRSGRTDRVTVDEAAFIDCLEAVDASLSFNATSALFVSTANPASYFAKLASSTAYEQVRVGWYEHPEKGIGRRPFPGDEHGTYLTSPWDQLQRAKLSPRIYAAEVAMDEGAAGGTVFDRRMLDGHRMDHCRDPDTVGDIVFARDESGYPVDEPESLNEADGRLTARELQSIRYEERIDGSWRLWLVPEYCNKTGTYRPPQDRTYVLFLDPGDGLNAANSAIVVLDSITGEQVGEWVSARYPARDAGRILVAAALWFGGLRLPLIGWETNGVGGHVLTTVKKLGYPRCFRDRMQGRDGPDKRTDKLGWTNVGRRKGAILDSLGDAVASKQVIIRSSRLIDEMVSFVLDSEHKPVQAYRADLTTGAREAHGDIAMAAAGARLLAETDPAHVSSRMGSFADPMTFSGRLKLDAEKQRRSAMPRWMQG